MGPPYEDRQVIDPETGAMRTVRCANVHHVNVVLQLESDGSRRTERVRVVMDQRGIKRVELR